MIQRHGRLLPASTLVLLAGVLVLVSACGGQEEQPQEPPQSQVRQAPEPTPARQGRERGPASGRFSLIMMVHTRSREYGNLPGVRAWGGETSAGPYTYRSIACQGNAPVNNISSDLPSYNARVRGSRVPSSLRSHPFEFRLRRSDSRLRMEGELTMTVCKLGPGPTPRDDQVRDEDKPKIRATFEATVGRGNAETRPFQGAFRLRGGSQRYADLEGAGTIAGYLFCFAPEGCAAKGGKYLDGQFVMEGRYHDRSPMLDR